MKIWLDHHPGNIHPAYQETVASAPAWAHFLNAGDFGSAYHRNTEMGRKSFASRAAEFLGPRLPVPNFSFPPKGTVAFACQRLPLRGEFVLDLDMYESLNRFSAKLSRNPLDKAIVRAAIGSSRCRGVACWSQAAKRSLELYLGPEAASKAQVVYPGISARPKKEKTAGRTRFLFVGRYFRRKGGEEALAVARELLASGHDAEFTFVTGEIPRGEKTAADPRIRFLPLMGREQVMGLFAEAHFFLMPSFFDPFGYVYLEAFAHGAVPVALKDYCTEEIIRDGVDGILADGYERAYFDRETRGRIDRYADPEALSGLRSEEEKRRVVRDLVGKISALLRNPAAIARAADEGWTQAAAGKFSTRRRWEGLKNIFKP